MQDIDGVEASNATQLGTMEVIEAADASTAPEEGAQVRLSGHSARKNNLFAGLSIRDQMDLGVEPMIVRGQDPVGRPTVEVEVTLERQSRFLDMANGQEAVLHVTCLGTDGEWQRLLVRKVIWNPRRD
ncbi:hypothetical protein ASF41_12570 [Methylobacterium sp. Leaf111]|nr:hypothetical protein ASF41_12570 [Methylobacterium sp. Leaf111]